MIGYRISAIKNRNEVSGATYILQGNDAGYLTAIVGVDGALYPPQSSVFIRLVTNNYEVVHERAKIGNVRVMEIEE